MPCSTVPLCCSKRQRLPAGGGILPGEGGKPPERGNSGGQAAQSERGGCFGGRASALASSSQGCPLPVLLRAPSRPSPLPGELPSSPSCSLCLHGSLSPRQRSSSSSSLSTLVVLSPVYFCSTPCSVPAPPPPRLSALQLVPTPAACLGRIHWGTDPATASSQQEDGGRAQAAPFASLLSPGPSTLCVYQASKIRVMLMCLFLPGVLGGLIS